MQQERYDPDGDIVYVWNNMMGKFNWIILLITLLPVSISAETLEEFEKMTLEDKEKFTYGDDFRGHKGIVFMCEYEVDDATLKKICERAKTDIALLAASNKIELYIVEDNDFIARAFVSAIKEYVNLEYYLTATKSNSEHEVQSVYGELRFERYYLHAIEEDAVQGTLGSMSRSGNLIFWSASTIDHAIQSEIVNTFSDEVEINIKKALTLFLKYK